MAVMVPVGAVVKSKEFSQIPLDIRLDTSLVFDNFYTNRQNRHVVDAAHTKRDKPKIIILKGASASGKTHLLQAACNALAEGNFMYIPARKFQNLSPEILNVEVSLECVCIDDVDSLLGNTFWEKAIFDIYNQAFDRKFSLLMSLSGSNLKFNLPDLRSRFYKTKTIDIPILEDAGKREAFLVQAKTRGIKIDDKVLNFIHNNYSRRLCNMLDLLEKLDQASMRNKHKITIPMVKEVVESTGSS